MFKYLVLENILTDKECHQIIELYDDFIVEPIEILDCQHTGHNFRNIRLSELIFERIKKYIPDNVCEVSHSWYISKFLPNHGSTSKDFDGNVLYEDKISQYTLLIYLNDNFDDGCTVICDPLFKEKIKIKPKTGSILLLNQDILYYTEKPQCNTKYIIKSDLMTTTNSKCY